MIIIKKGEGKIDDIENIGDKIGGQSKDFGLSRTNLN